jgi:hypothetical protein
MLAVRTVEVSSLNGDRCVCAKAGTVSKRCADLDLREGMRGDCQIEFYGKRRILRGFSPQRLRPFDRVPVSWENKPTNEEPYDPGYGRTTNDRTIDQFQLPGSLMESFDAYREESVKAVTDGFSHSKLAWFLDLMNRFRGPDDRKDSLLDIFDPCMFTTEHPAWDSEPGTSIDMPALTSEVAALAHAKEFTDEGRLEIVCFRQHADTYDDGELLAWRESRGPPGRPENHARWPRDAINILP